MTMARRRFVQGVGALALSTTLLGERRRARAGSVPMGPQKGAPKEGDIELPAGATMPMRTLGRTGVKVSLLGLGGFHLGIPRDDKEAVRIIHAAMDHGVTFLDNCWDYNGGKSEERMGLALAAPSRRQKAFLMTKLDGRTRDSAGKQLEQSLQRLRTDHIDLVQVHEVIRMQDPERVFGPGGAIEALVAAKQAGKLRFIGFTGHKDPAIHLHMIETAAQHGFTFDTVQLPVNVMDAHYKSFAKNVIPRAREHEMGVLGMKPLGSGIILRSGVVAAPECLRYSMSQPVSVQITGCETMGVLAQALA
ncbi:MAG TPA: aldo/keto reductase, partial [Polyangia bacterium]|nr:aldo/keto reductase [Polyangia bacterium]